MDGETLQLIMAIDIENLPPKTRAAVAAMAIFASTMTTIGIYEGFKPAAYIPVPGDPPTIGFGSTRHEDGRPVKMGDKVTPEKALRMLNVELEGKVATPLKKCITAPLYDYEWAAYITLAYNIGVGAFCNKAKPGQPPNLIDLINAGKYAEACKRIDAFNGKYITKNGERVRVVIPGLVKRRANERAICEGKAQ